MDSTPITPLAPAVAYWLRTYLSEPEKALRRATAEMNDDWRVS